MQQVTKHQEIFYFNSYNESGKGYNSVRIFFENNLRKQQATQWRC